jgi:hypothetical protein
MFAIVKGKLVLLFCTVFFQSLTIAQQIQHHTIETGLPSNNIYYCFFDRQHVLWLCTDNGLTRFDGKRFQTYGIQDGLPDTDIVYATQDSSGYIWAKSFQKLPVFLQPGQLQFYSVTAIIPADTVTKDVNYTIFPLQDGSTALLSATGNIRVIKNEKLIRSIHTMHNCNPDYSYVTQLKNGDLLVSLSGIKNFRIGRKVITPLPAYNKKLAFLKGAGNRLHVQTGAGDISSFEFNETINQFVQTGSYSFTLPVNRFGFAANHLFTGLAGGIITVLPGKETPADTLAAKGLLSHAAAGKENIIALSTADNGFFLLSSKFNGQYKTLEGKPLFFSRTGNGDLLLHGMYPYTVNVSTNKKLAGVFQNYTAGMNCTESSPKTLIEYGNNVVIRSISNNKTVKTIFTGTIKQVKIINDSIRLLASSHEVCLFNITSHTKKTLHTGRSTCALLTADSTLYTGTINGLMIQQKGGNADYCNAAVLQNVRITDLVNNNGVIWAATAGNGLVALRNNKVLFILTDKDNPSHNNITKIAATTDTSIMIAAPGTLKQLVYHYKNGFIEKKLLIRYSMPASESIFQFFAFDKKLAATGVKGYFIFDTDNKPDRINQKLYISAVQINSLSLPLKNEYILHSNQTDIGIYFSVPEYNNSPYSIQYVVNNNTWKTIDEDFIRLRNLNFGTYNIQLRVLNNYGEVSDSKSIKLEIRAPWYRRIWFYAVVGALFSLLLLVTLQQRLTRKFRTEKAALFQEQRVKELELSALKAQVNPHFVFNCLNSIKMLLYENDTEQAETYLDKFAQLFRQTLDGASNELHTIQDEVEYIHNYLQLEQLRFSNRFTYKITIHESIDAHVALIPSMLLQPYVENAIKHGIGALQTDTGFIEIAFNLNDNSILCSIKDNGIGRKAALALKEQNKKLHEGKGMMITEKRAALYNIDLSITDLEQPAGTVITLTIPLLLIKKDV